jgi:DNA/RNA-binding domain of Phe-tRNA-synthetase-like protein
MTSTVGLDVSDVIRTFPTFRVAVIAVDDLRIRDVRSHDLDNAIRDAEARIAAGLAATDMADVPELRSWREAYKAFGVRKTSYRSSIERLLKNIQRGAGVPRVNALVDAYNMVSALHRMPIGADDLERVTPPLAFRYSRPGDTFVALGDPAAEADPPKPGEVVYADGEKCLCRRWNWYQDAGSAVGPQTTRAVLTVQTLTADEAQVRAAAAELAEMIGRHVGGRADFDVADSERPWVEAAVG